MKKFLSILLIIVLSVLLVACSNATNATNDTESDVSAVVVQNPDLNEIIPKGATYYKSCTWDYAVSLLQMKLGESLSGGQKFPTPQTGDVLLYDGMIYVYNAKMTNGVVGGFTIDESMNGWSVRFAGAIGDIETVNFANTIADAPVLCAPYFADGFNLGATEIVIPDNMTDISYLLANAILTKDVHLFVNNVPTNTEMCIDVTGLPESDEDGNMIFKVPYQIYVKGATSADVKMQICGEKTKGKKITTYVV